MANTKLNALNGFMLIPGVSAGIPQVSYAGTQKGTYQEVEKTSGQIATCTYTTNGNRLKHDDATCIFIDS